MITSNPAIQDHLENPMKPWKCYPKTQTKLALGIDPKLLEAIRKDKRVCYPD